jgi:hypothetical protein
MNSFAIGHALVALEELRGAPAAWAVGAGGGSLAARVRRLFEPRHHRSSGGGMAGLSLLAVSIVASVVWAAGPGEEIFDPTPVTPIDAEPQSVDAEPIEANLEQSTPLRERSVSLNAQAMPLRDALAEICRQVDLSLDLDEAALAAAGLDSGAAVTLTLVDESFEQAMARLTQLLNQGRFTGAFWEIREDRLVISTIVAKQQRILEQLPDWLQQVYNRGLLAEVDEVGNVVSVTAGSVVTDEILAKLATLPRLRELHIETTNEVTAAGLAHLGKMAALEKLSLYSVNVEGEGLGDAAIGSVAGLKWLHDLTIGECGTTDAGVRQLEAMQQLTRLELRQEGRLTDAALVSIGKLRGLARLDLTSYVGTKEYGRMRFGADGIRQLAGLQELEELHLVGHDVPAEALVFDRLTSLSLGGPGVDDACADRIATCRNLKSLSLSYTSISDDGMRQLATLPALARLEIDSHVITDDGISHLKSLKQLTHLSMRASRLTDETLTHLAEIDSLVRLDLHGSGHSGSVFGELFTVEGLKQLKALPKLRTLWLMNLQSPGGYLGLQELTQLRSITLHMCDIRPDEVGALEVALPQTTISAMSGGGSIRPAR